MVQGDLNSFGDYMYTQEAIRIISEHDVDIPLFYYVAFQCKYESSLSSTRTVHVTHSGIDVLFPNLWALLTGHDDMCMGIMTRQFLLSSCSHLPLEAPDGFVDMYPDTWREDRRWYAAMTSYWDTALGNITAAVKAKGMWENVSARARHHLSAFAAVGTDFL